MVILFHISLTVLILAIIVGAILYLRKLARRTLYSYRAMAVVGLVIFLVVFLVLRVIRMLDGGFPEDLQSYLQELTLVFPGFAVLILPIMIIVATISIVSSIVVIVREGWSLTNALGLILGGGILGLFVLNYSLYELLDNFIDVHTGIGGYMELFLETTAYVILAYFECMLLASLIFTVKAGRYIPSVPKKYMIILGCYPGETDELAPILRGRVERAREFATLQKEPLIFVPSGGKGTDENRPEAVAIARYLVIHGVSKKQILIEDKATNTYENFAFSKKLLGSGTVAFATSGYHVFRSGVIAEGLGLRVEGIGSKTRWYFYFNAAVREFVANLRSECRQHIFNVVLISLAMIGLIFLSYYNVL